MIRKQSPGFSIVAILAAIVVLAGIGFGGYYVWHRNSNKSGTAANTTATTAQQKTADHTNSTTPVNIDPSEGGKYLVIKEWGVRMLLPPELQGDVDYGINKNVNVSFGADDPQVYGDEAFLSSKKLTAISSQCGIQEDPDHPGQYEGGTLSINRTTQRLSPYKNDLSIDGYWYQPVNSNGGTCYQGSDGTKEGDFQLALVAAFKSMQAVPKN